MKTIYFRRKASLCNPSSKELISHRRKEEEEINYPYFGSELPNQSLESFLEDVNPCSTSNVYQNSGAEPHNSIRVYQNKTPSSGEGSQHVPNHVYQNKSPIAGNTISDDAAPSFFAQNDKFSALHSNPAKQNGVITGVVRLILEPHSFVRRNGTAGMVQSIIVVDPLAKRLNSDVWRYKIVAWNEQAKNLNIEVGRTYRFEHFKMKSTKWNCGYPGQDKFEVHLTPISTIKMLM